LLCWFPRLIRPARTGASKSFLVLFFKKELLPSPSWPGASAAAIRGCHRDALWRRKGRPAWLPVHPPARPAGRTTSAGSPPRSPAPAHGRVQPWKAAPPRAAPLCSYSQGPAQAAEACDAWRLARGARQPPYLAHSPTRHHRGMRARSPARPPRQTPAR